MPSQPRRDDSKIAFIIIAIVVVFVVVSIVLSAILYFMVIGFGGSSTTTPAAAYSKLSVEGGVRISILSITKSDVWWDDVRVQVDEGIHFAEWETRGVDLDGGNPVTASYATEILGEISVTLTVTDINGDGFVSIGDHFTLTANPGLSSGATYSACLFYEPTGQRMGSITFTA